MSTSKHAFITGGGTGVGRAIAHQLHRDGWQVTVAGRRVEPLDRVVDELGAGAGRVSCDVTIEEGVETAMSDSEQARGPIDAVIANAGGTESAPTHRVSAETFARVLEVNLLGAFFTARRALEGMLQRGRGRIVFVASTAGLKGYPYVAPYCAAKHGVVGLMRSMAVETAARGITVNAVCPGFTETPLLERSLDRIVDKTGLDHEQARAQLLGPIPRGQFTQPEEVAATISFLCSDRAAAITGHALSVSGGEV